MSKMMNGTMGKTVILTLLCAVTTGVAKANNLAINSVKIKGRDDTTAWVQFDISWENSWRHGSGGDPLYFHDAAWVFLKFKANNGQVWTHAKLKGRGINPDGYSHGAGTAIEMVVPDDGLGVFIRRAGDGAGTTAVQRVSVVWDIASHNLAKTDTVLMQVFGLEMCYVAEGAFRVGDGLATQGQLFEGGGGTNAFLISSAAAITLADEKGCLWGARQDGAMSMGGVGVIETGFPNGYNAYYCMKYPVTQGQYSDFLNTLTREQQTTRCSAVSEGSYMSDSDGETKNRNTVQLTVKPDDNESPCTFATITPDYACCWLSWADLAAFSDWSGLRPMSELEYEKACRGPLPAVPGEFAWGSTKVIKFTDLQGEDGSGEEYYEAGNIHCPSNGGPASGPVRVGISARPGRTREEAGATYWGIMDMSGNLWERPVTIGSSAGRSFRNVHGDGVLTEAGEANVTSWPGVNAAGVGYRGGAFGQPLATSNVSDRYNGTYTNRGRWFYFGGRAVRTAPTVQE